MELAQLLETQIAEHLAVANNLHEAVRTPFLRLAELCCTSVTNGGKILFCGNGGSAADAQHLAAELVVRFKFNRRALPAIALTTDTSILTAAANDFSYDEVFARQVEALARAEDIVIGITTSGQSPNVLRALEAARRVGAVAAGFAGRDGGAMVGVAEPLIIVPSTITARIQEMHILLGHMLCDAVESVCAS